MRRAILSTSTNGPEDRQQRLELLAAIPADPQMMLDQGHRLTDVLAGQLEFYELVELLHTFVTANLMRTGIECAAHHLLESYSINPHRLICILTRPLS